MTNQVGDIRGALRGRVPEREGLDGARGPDQAAGLSLGRSDVQVHGPDHPQGVHGGDLQQGRGPAETGNTAEVQRPSK